MPSTVREVVFSEPSGRNHAAVMFSSALFFSSLYVYHGTAGRFSSASWLLFMVVGTALSGIAESLPKDRRRAAGLLRITAILVLLSMLAAIVFSPEFIVGNG